VKSRMPIASNTRVLIKVHEWSHCECCLDKKHVYHDVYDFIGKADASFHALEMSHERCPYCRGKHISTTQQFFSASFIEAAIYRFCCLEEIEDPNGIIPKLDQYKRNERFVNQIAQEMDGQFFLDDVREWLTRICRENNLGTAMLLPLYNKASKQ